MNVLHFGTLFVVLIAAIEADGNYPHKRYGKVLHELREDYHRRGMVDKRSGCVDLDGSCRSSLAWKRCCGDLVCYWPNGVSIWKDGHCVECIDNGQKCQLDRTCCGDLVCHRESVAQANGLCGQKREKGEPCHKNDNCKSGNCGDRTASSMWTKGTCQ